MRYLNIKLKNSKFMMTHLRPYSSDPVEHDHGDDYQITIPIVGNPSLDINNKSNILTKNTRMVTPPGEKHIHFTRENESRLLLINLNKRFLENVYLSRIHNGSSGLEFSFYSEGSSKKLIRFAEEAVRVNLFNEDSIENLEELELELAEAFLTIQEGSHSELWKYKVAIHHHPILKQMIEYINDHYQNDLSLDMLSKISNVNKFYLIRLFKEILGCTPSQYILNKRIEFAIKLLKTTNLDITSICYEVGFGSLNTFERVFKKRFGCTISAFRKKK